MVQKEFPKYHLLTTGSRVSGRVVKLHLISQTVGGDINMLLCDDVESIMLSQRPIEFG